MDSASQEFFQSGTAKVDANTSNVGSWVHIAGASTMVVKTGAGILKRIVINTPVDGGVISAYANLSAAAADLIARVTNASPNTFQPRTQNYDLNFATGLTIVTAQADDITVVYL